MVVENNILLFLWRKKVWIKLLHLLVQKVDVAGREGIINNNILLGEIKIWLETWCDLKILYNIN